MGRSYVIGASGLVGGALLSHLRARAHDATGTGRGNAGAHLIAYDMIEQPLSWLAPDLGPSDTVYVMAAATRQDWVSGNPQAAHRLNVEATGARIAEALAAGAGVVFLSTEVVFGDSLVGHAENDATAPLTLYARQKAEIESLLQASSGAWWLMRSGWIVGGGAATRDVVATTYHTLLRSGARIAGDNVFTVTAIEDTVTAMVELVERRLTGIWHIAANPPVSRVALADAIVRASRFGDRMKYEPTTFDALQFDEPRPARAWISNDKLRTALGLEFEPVQSIVARKVAEMDARMAAATAGAA